MAVLDEGAGERKGEQPQFLSRMPQPNLIWEGGRERKWGTSLFSMILLEDVQYFLIHIHQVEHVYDQRIFLFLGHWLLKQMSASFLFLCDFNNCHSWVCAHKKILVRVSECWDSAALFLAPSYQQRWIFLVETKKNYPENFQTKKRILKHTGSYQIMGKDFKQKSKAEKLQWWASFRSHVFHTLIVLLPANSIC